MRDREFLLKELEELLNVKICWHEEQADTGGQMAEKHREQASIYEDCLELLQSIGKNNCYIPTDVFNHMGEE